MRALVVTSLGDASVLSWQHHPEPEPREGELLVRVRAVAVDWADLMKREGRYPGAPPPPFVSGHCVCGDVIGHGPGVTAPAVGTRVFGSVPDRGAAAELITAPATWLHPVPGSVSAEAAAALAGSFPTAEVALTVFGHLTPGETVLVNAAAGGFGSAAVQLSKAHGAGVVVGTVGSPGKISAARRFGADVAVIYEAVAEAVASATDAQGVHLVAESVGGGVLGRSLDSLRPLGRLVSVGASAGRSSDRFRLHTLFELGISVSGFSFGMLIRTRPDIAAAATRQVAELAGAGAVDPPVARVFPVSEAAAAHRFLQDRQSLGRTILTMGA